MRMRLLNRRKKNDLISCILKYNSDAVFILNNLPERTIIDCNDAALKLFGFSRTDLIGKSIEIVHLNNYSYYEFDKRLRMKTKNNERFHLNRYRMKRKDGGIFYSEHIVIPLINSLGRCVGWVSVVKDISEWVFTELACIESINKYKTCLDISPMMLLLLDKNGRFEFVNEKGRKFLGLDSVGYVGRSWIEDFIPEEQQLRIKKIFLDLLSSIDENKEYFINLIGTEEGKLNPASWLCSVYNNVNYRNVNFILTGKELECGQKNNQDEKNDIDMDLRRLNSHLQKQREKEKAMTTHKILDDMGQVLTGLSLEASLLEKMIQQNGPDINRMLITCKLGEMSKIINSLIQFGRELSTGIRPTVIDDMGLSAAIVWLAGNYQKETGIIFMTDEVADSVEVDIDVSIIIFRICEELFDNIKEHSRAGRVHVRLSEKGGCLSLNITDDGIGLNRDASSNPKSFGLLKIRESVRTLKGTIVISGKKEVGTSVDINIPVM